MKVWTSPALIQWRRIKSTLYMGGAVPYMTGAMDGKTYLGALRGFLPSTTHRCPPVLHLLQTFSLFGKSHFI